MAALRPLIARPGQLPQLAAKYGTQTCSLGRVRLAAQTRYPPVNKFLRSPVRAVSSSLPSPWPVLDNRSSKYNDLIKAWSVGWLWPFGSSTPAAPQQPPSGTPIAVDPNAAAVAAAAQNPAALPAPNFPAFTPQVASGDKMAPAPTSSLTPAELPVAQPEVLDALATSTPATEAVAAATYSWTPVYAAQLFLLWFHGVLGSGWILPIAITTLLVRLLVLYPTVLQNRNAAKMMLLRPHIEEMQERFKKRQQAGRSTPEDQKAMKEEYARLMSFHGVSPFKTMLSGLVSAPVFITFFLSLRSLPDRFPSAGLDTGGILWFKDLSLPDPYFVLPLVSSAITLLTIELGSDSGGAAANTKMKRFFQGMVLLSLIIFIKFPALVFIYWISNGLLSLGVSQMLKIHKVRKFCDIPIITAAVASENSKNSVFDKIFKWGNKDEKKVSVTPPEAKPPPVASKLDPSLHINKKAAVPQTFAQRPKKK